MKLFQIEEPDCSPADPDLPGAAVGIDVSGAQAEVAVAIGGNAVVLSDREGFEVDLTVPSATAAVPEWQATLDALQALPEIGTKAPIGYGGGISLGTAIRWAPRSGYR